MSEIKSDNTVNFVNSTTTPPDKKAECSILVFDNYDSFTYNLVHMVKKLGYTHKIYDVIFSLNGSVSFSFVIFSLISEIKGNIFVTFYFI